ncbi:MULTISPECIES: guanine deaminase [Mycetohabitans]|nr:MULTISPECIES: guanine deaminase [Mycetohabitans]MCF7695069.1 guanine deaminase [Mycetohabitans sp. B2]MCG1046447.1 guanine deaminase [Mycetohabitans sp. B6]
MAQTVYRARLLVFDAPFDGIYPGAEQRASFNEDGALLVEHGRVVASGAYDAVAPRITAQASVISLRDKLIVPGFIDTHLHFAQTEIIASPAPSLLPWLQTWTFPAERRFEDAAYAREVADFFLDQLLAAGTTSAAVYCSVHPQSVHALFEASHARNLRLIAGKVLMDRNCPPFLRDTAQSGYDDSLALMTRWHGTGRQLYALTPRFAPTSTQAQLDACRTLAAAHPDVFIQSHVAENTDEIAWVAQLFPGHRSYLDVYEHYGLLRRRAIYGHCIHLDDVDRARMAACGALASHCPTSNLFLGSGLFDFEAADATNMPVALGSDVGAGTSFSMLQTMNEAHKIARLRGYHLSALRMFWLATAAAAHALELAGHIGTLAAGSEADFIVLDPAATTLLARRTAQADSLEALLFAFALLGDDRAVAHTYAAGRLVHSRATPPELAVQLR